MGLEVAAVSPAFFDLTGRILSITCQVNNENLEREFLSGSEDDTVYPNGLAFVRWEATIPAPSAGVSLSDLVTVTDSFNNLQSQPNFDSIMPWYNNEQAARDLATDLAQAYLAGESQLERQQGGFYGPWFAYGVDSNGSLEIVSSEGGGGAITGQRVMSPDAVEVFAIVGQQQNSEDILLRGPWLTVYQERLAIPFKVGSFDVSIQAIPRPGVEISAEVLFV